MSKRSGLGRGLSALIPDIEEKLEAQDVIEDIKIEKIITNPYQPRKNFDEKAIEELAQSIKENGLIQPIIVVKRDNGYMLIAGERRLRAVKSLNEEKITAIIKDISDEDIMKWGVIENIQREDLNPIEEAIAYENIRKTFSITQEQLAETVGKSRSYITNTLRLLDLCDEVKEVLINGEISPGHARIILRLDEAERQINLAEKIISEKLSVRDVEKLFKKDGTPRTRVVEEVEVLVEVPEKETISGQIKYVEDELIKALGTKVNLRHGKEKGIIEIEYYGIEDLNRILELLE